ncbi:hypothetical protein GCM10027062_44880 [Nocardioides hungaricus]
MTVFYDAGVLIAADRGDPEVWAEHRAWLTDDVLPVTTAPVVAQVSRSSRQARLRMFLGGCEVVPFAPEEAHAVGSLLGRAGTSDVVDAHLVHLGVGADLVTSDPDDLGVLADQVSPRPNVRSI